MLKRRRNLFQSMTNIVKKVWQDFFSPKSINQFVQMCLFTVNCGDHSARTCAECGSSLSRCGGECILCNERCEPLNQINPSSCNSKYNLLLINIPLEAWTSMNLRILLQSNLVIRNVLIRNELALRNHFQWPIVNLLH